MARNTTSCPAPPRIRGGVIVRRLTLVLVGLSVCLGFSREVRAQKGDSGSITGCVLDQTGSPIKGVKVTTSSPTQIGGRKVSYTNDEGCFRFPILDPGVFEVRADAPK